MKTCAYIFISLALIGVVWAQRGVNPYEVLSEDSNLIVRSEQPYYAANEYRRPQQQYTEIASASYSAPEVAEASVPVSDANAKIELIEKQITILTNYYNKMRLSLQSIARKMPSAQNAPASSNEGKEVLLVVNALTDRMSNVESSISQLSRQMDEVARLAAEPKVIAQQPAATSQAGDSESALLCKEILIVVKAMSKRVDKVELGISSIPSQRPIMDKLSNIEVSVAQLANQVSALANQKPAQVETSPSSNNSSPSPETSVVNQEMLVLFKTMSEKLEKIEGYLANAPQGTTGASSASAPVTEDKLVAIVGAVTAPGKVKVDETGKKDLLEAISEVGGFTPNADRTSVTVRRGPKVFTIDVERIMSENLLSFMLEGKDIVVVKEKDSKRMPPSPARPAPTAPPAPAPAPAPAPSLQTTPEMQAPEAPRPRASTPRTKQPPSVSIIGPAELPLLPPETEPAPPRTTLQVKPRLAPQAESVSPRRDDFQERELSMIKSEESE